MTTTTNAAVAVRPSGLAWRARLQDWLPRLVLAPSFALVLIFVYGFNLWTLLLSFTNSKAFTNLNFIGWANYQKLWTWTFQTSTRRRTGTRRWSTWGFSAASMSCSVCSSA